MRPLDGTTDPNKDAKLDPYELRVIGEKAARTYLNDGLNLSDAVVSAIKGSGHKLNNHHIQRVVEHANLRAFRELRQAGPGIGTPVEFEGGPASATAVIEKLNGSPMAKKEAPMISPADEQTKTASGLLGKVQHLLSDQRTVKTAAVKEPLTEREEMDTVDLYVKLGEAVRQCRTTAAILEEKRASALNEVCRHAGQAIRDGATLGDVHRILCAAAPDHYEQVKTAMDAVAFHVCPQVGLMGDYAAESLEKISSNQAPNPKHPLFQKMAEFVRVSDELLTKRGAAEILVDGRARLAAVLRQQ